MPIVQQRMIDMIGAAEHCHQAWLDLKAQIAASMDLHQQGIIDVAAMINQIHSAFYTTAPRVGTLVLMAKERQHFKDWARRNDYQTNRRANKRAGGYLTKGEKIARAGKTGMVRTYDEDQLAKAQRPAFTLDPSVAIGTLATDDIGPPTPEQLAADDALMASIDEDELEAYKAELRKGDQ